MSGYDLRKEFGSTPLMHFSQSPGAIYPALSRLERRGWIAGRVEKATPLRPRKVFRPTAEGIRELKLWLTAPVAREDVVWRLETLMLRFSFMSGVLPHAAVIEFLKSLAQEVNSYLVGLRAYCRANSDGMPASARLALRGGVDSYAAQLRSIQRALLEFKAGPDSG